MDKATKDEVPQPLRFEKKKDALYIEPSIVERLKAAHPESELLVLAGAGFTVVAKSPGKKEMDLFRSTMFDEKRRAGALERFVRVCLVYPAPEEVTSILDLKPGLVERWAEKLLELGGSNEELQVKKL